jgi:hypothetical protein
MKANELIQQLREMVFEFGDRNIEINGEYNSDYPLNTKSRLQITRVDIFVDSENIQIMVDNER